MRSEVFNSVINARLSSGCSCTRASDVPPAAHAPTPDATSKRLKTVTRTTGPALPLQAPPPTWTARSSETMRSATPSNSPVLPTLLHAC